MARFFIVILLASVVILGNETAFSQTTRDRGEPIFTPLKNLRERAANGVLKDAKVKFCAACKLSGKLCPKCACKRKERAEKEAEEKAKEEAAKEAEMKKLEAEAKKAELEAKLLEEQDLERNKPWDIADEANLKSPSALLKLAAASKQDQDLAPKKQQALDYMSQLGCNKDPKVEAAILAGLKDYNARVRLAAVQAVLVAVRGPMPEVLNPSYDPYQLSLGQPTLAAAADPNGAEEADPAAAADPCPKYDPCEACKGDRRLKKLRKKLCSGCRGKGCNACNYNGGTAEVYLEPCPTCIPQDESGCGCMTCSSEDGCRSCCPSPEIMAELKRIAFDPDPQRKNCRYEPSIDVRNLALEALNVCPVLPIIKKNGGGGIIETGEGDAEKPQGIGEEGAGAGDNTDSSGDVKKEDTEEEKKKKANEEGVIPLQDDDTSTQYGADSPYKSVVYAGAKSRMLGARLSKFLHNDEYMVEFDGDYLIPTGKRLYIQNSAGASQIVEVLSSEVGFVKVSPVEGTLFDQDDSRLSVGIVQ